MNTNEGKTRERDWRRQAFAEQEKRQDLVWRIRVKIAEATKAGKDAQDLLEMLAKVEEGR